MFENATFPNSHIHNGIDQPRIKASDIVDLPTADVKGFFVTKQMPWTTPQDALNYRYFYSAFFDCEIIAIGTWRSNGGTSSTVTIQKTYQAGSTVSISDAINTSSTGRNSDTTYFDAPLTATDNGYPKNVLHKGDMLSCVAGGTLTNLKDLIITIYLKPLNGADYTA
jgi:hypothetical protein